MKELIDELEFDEVLERAYRIGAACEESGDLRSAATYFRVAADQHLGDAAARLARVLFAFGQDDEAARWCRVAVADGFTEAEELLAEGSGARQRFLEHAARITVGAPIPWTPSGVSSGFVDLADVARVTARTEALRALDQQYGGFACHAAVLEHLALVEPLVLAEGARAEMASAVAEVHELAGWTAFDSGLPGRALPHFEHALTLARQAENERIIASVLGCAGRMFLHHNASDDALKAFQLGSLAAHNWSAEQQSLSTPVATISTLTTDLATYQPEQARDRALALTALARNHLATGDTVRAREFGARALAAAVNVRSARVDDHLRWLVTEAAEAGTSALVKQINARFARRA